MKVDVNMPEHRSPRGIASIRNLCWALMARLTILDDYQRVALDYADWSRVAERYTIDVVHEHLVGETLIERLRQSEVVVAMRERTAFPASVLEQLPKLRLLIATGSRNPSIDVAAAGRLGVTVCGTESGSSTSVPELVFGLMIALARHLVVEHEGMRSGGWQHTVGSDLSGATLGIVGLGRLGGSVAGLARAFGMDVIAWSRHLTQDRADEFGARATTKEDLLRSSDFISIHLPLTPETIGLLGRQELAWLKPTSYLVNTSRGPIIDEGALLEALSSDRLAGAGLDVYDTEPLPGDHPLRAMSNVILSPHLGYVTRNAYARFYAGLVEGIQAYVDGSPIRVMSA
jgi:phosphoglycerate dehydrogenase-like enzyme